MKKVIVLLAVLCMAGMANAANVCSNGNFENATPFFDWYKAGDNLPNTVSINAGDNGPSDFGSQSAQIYSPSVSLDIRSKCFDNEFSPGNTITISFDYKMIGIDGTTTDGTWLNNGGLMATTKSGSYFREMIRFYQNSSGGNGGTIIGGTTQYWNGQTTSSVAAPIGGTIKFFFPFSWATNDQWQTASVQLVVPALATTLNWNAATKPSDGTFLGTVLIDNVVITPEPATITLLGLGLSMLLRRRK